MQRLLIVDDEWLIRKGIVQMVGRLAPEWEAAEANNGKEALGRIENGDYDLIFCDIKMPEMNGIDLLQRLSDMGHRVPIVFLTGFDDFAFIQNALRLRAYDYLLKPLDDDALTAVLDKYRKDFLNMARVPPKQQGAVNAFAFELSNAMASFDSAKVAAVIGEGQQALSGYLSQAEFVDEVIRVANQFFAKYRLQAFAKKLAISPNDLCNLDHIRHAIHLRFSLLLEHKAEEEDRIIRMAKDHIEERVRQPLTLQEVANVVHLHPTYFSEYFKEKSGETFSRFVARTKIEEAKRLLRDPTTRIVDISENLGYRDPRSFTKMFKLIMGMTPKEYRDTIP